MSVLELRVIAEARQDQALKFTRDHSTANTIRKVQPGLISLGDREYRSNIGLLVDDVLENWPDCPVAELDVELLQPLVAEKPEMLLLGTGSQRIDPPRELLFALARAGIGLEVMDTAAACRTFNILIGEDRRPAAILYIND